jgi:PAS domain S-box-containing protein
MKGYTPEEVIEQSLEEMLTPESYNRVVNVLASELAEDKEKDPERSVTLEIEEIRKDGSIIWTEITASFVRDNEKRPTAVLGVTRDITERKQAEKEKEQLESQLARAQKMEAIGTLAGGVAHDLNNVLSGIVSYPDLLLMDLPEDSSLRQPILTVKQSGQRASEIVQDLLTLARRGVFTTEVMNLNQTVNNYLNSPEHERLIEFHPDAKIESNLETNLLNIMGSPVQMSKTIMNLVSNAAEAMPEGGKIIISTDNIYIDKPIEGYDNVKEGDYVILRVSDTGIGLSSEGMDRVFEPFYTKKVMGRSGTGLGMAVVWGTVKDHKGYIDIQSTENMGTTFTLYFPVTRKELDKERESVSIEDYRGGGESILVVDDVEEQKEIASNLIKKLGYAVTAVSSGEEAVEYLKNHSADLLVLDMIMDPGIGGLETYKRILEINPGQKAIIASGFSETEAVREAQRLGAGQYIKKPYSLEKIGVAIKEELGN